jgi:hypothetical protein
MLTATPILLIGTVCTLRCQHNVSCRRSFLIMQKENSLHPLLHLNLSQFKFSSHPYNQSS